ncbi:hypothetical protein EV652_108312 [Kribbella steppae]|uniref:Tachylectin n=1 Tax=Kribbella steppae TaxID=2512223 RepID=A0A4R2HB54_9ACTN|nr:hypothetical protein [Kribbella steppae]TCO24777.1 hypothetical protein EV652_108312 [Kribbella steppae]
MRRSISIAAAAVLAAAGFGGPAHAAVEGSAATCRVYAGSVTADGAHTGGPTPNTPGGTTPGVFAPGTVRISTTFTTNPNVVGADIAGWVLQGDSLYQRKYSITTEGSIDPGWPNDLQRIGGGWTNFTALEVSQYEAAGSPARTTAYGLRNDGMLFRWNVRQGTWSRTGSTPGFASVKSMALISKTRTYDTFLASTRGGALYTIHVPTTSPMKPVVKVVRSRTWQGFEKLIASKCGQYGTWLLGIDKDTKAGYLYAVGHANGLSTVIQGLGKVQGTYPDPVYFRWAGVASVDPLNGE